MEKLTTTATREALNNDVDLLKRNALQVVADVKEHANAHVGAARQRVDDTIQTARKNAGNHPLALLGIGFAGGFLFGAWARR